MSTKNNIFKSIRYIATGVLTAGVIASVGLLSFCGMLAISPSIPLAIAAFVLAGFVEGEVFKQNIFDGLGDLRLLSKQRSLEALIIKEFDLTFKGFKATDAKDQIFLNLYYNQLALVASFEHKKLSANDKTNHATAKRNLKIMREYVVARVLNTNADTAFNDKGLDEKIQALNNQRNDFERRIQLLRASAIVSIISGMGAGFATASSLAVAGSALGVTLSAAFIWPLAAVAAIGGAFLIFHTAKDMLFNETVSKWRTRLNKWFKRREYDNNQTESNAHYYARTIGTGLLVGLAIGLSVAATLATAGTWWFAVKEGIQLWPAIARNALSLTAFLVPVSALSGIAFSLRNSLQSVKYIVKQTRDIQPWQWVKRKGSQLVSPLERENTWQAMNPFRLLARLIALPYTLLVFIGHTISVGLSGDRVPGLEIPCAVAGTANDMLTDGHYIFDEGHEHKVKPHKMEDDGHHHGTLPSLFLAVALSPLHVLSAAWSHAFKNKTDTTTFSATLKHHLGIHEHETYKSTTQHENIDSTTMVNLRFQAASCYLSKQEDIAKLNEIKTAVTTTPKKSGYDSRTLHTLLASVSRAHPKVADILENIPTDIASYGQ